MSIKCKKVCFVDTNILRELYIHTQNYIERKAISECVIAHKTQEKHYFNCGRIYENSRACTTYIST